MRKRRVMKEGGNKGGMRNAGGTGRRATRWRMGNEGEENEGGRE